MHSNYFIKDAALDSKGLDSFHFKDYAMNIKRIIEEHKPPFNIALVGKWGVGKTSILNLLKKELEGKNECFVFELNAWKYESESLRRAFLKQLWKKLGGEDRGFINKIRDILVDVKSEPKSIKKTFTDLSGPLASLGILWILGTTFLFSIYLLIHLGLAIFTGEPNGSINWKKLLEDFEKSIWIPLLIPPLFVTALSCIKGGITNIKIAKPPETADEYEDLFKEQLEIYSKSQTNFKKMIVIVDDLDRLSPKKVVDALDAIKAFVDVSECIFLVPCDEEILKHAINTQKSLSREMGIADGEQYLDKLFQFRIKVPPIIEQDMKEYTNILLNQEVPELVNACCGITSQIVDILIHADVTTPRHVKKLVNVFANNVLIARQRENEGCKLENGLLTNPNGLRMLAKLSVLQSDFSDFYRGLLLDYGLMEKILEIYANGALFNDIPDTIQRFFVKKEEQPVVTTTKGESLINFLMKNQYILCENLAPFIYLAQDSVGLKTGDEKQRAIRKAMVSGNEKGILDRTGKDISPFDAAAIVQEVKNADVTDLSSVLKAAYQIFPNISPNYKVEMADEISCQLQRVRSNSILQLKYYLVESERYMDVYLAARNKAGAEDALFEATTQILTRSSKWTKTNGSMLSAEEFNQITTKMLGLLLENYELISERLQTLCRDFISIAKPEYEVFPFSQLYPIYSKYSKVFITYLNIPNFYTQLCDFIASENAEDLDEVIAILNEVGPIVRQDNLDAFLSTLPKLIKADERVTSAVIGLLDPIAESIPVKHSTELTIAFLNLETPQLGLQLNSLKLIGKLRWSLLEDNSTVPDLLVKVLQNNNQEVQALAGNLLAVFAKREGLDNCDKVVNCIRDNFMANSAFDNILESLNPYFTANQRNLLIQPLQTAFGYTTYDANRCSRGLILVQILIHEKLNWVYLNQIFQNVTPYWGNIINNLQWGRDVLNLIGILKEVTEQSLVDQVTSILLNTLYSQGQYDLMITGLMKIGTRINDSFVLDAITKVMSMANNEQNVIDGLVFLGSVIKHINNENKNLNQFVKYIINNLHYSPVKFLTELRNSLTRIQDVDVSKLCINVLNLDNDRFSNDYNLICEVTRKFFMATTNKLQVIQELIQRDSEERTLDLLHELVEEMNTNELRSLLEELIDKTIETKSEEFEKRILIFISKYKNIVSNSSIGKLVSSLLISKDDTVMVEICDILMEKYTDYDFGDMRKHIVNQLFPAFRAVNSSAKEKLVLLSKNFRMDKVFRKSENKTLMSEIEVELVHNILATRKKTNSMI